MAAKSGLSCSSAGSCSTTIHVGALPREVVDDAKGDIRTRPVGTGPYRLKEWKRGSKLILTANPKYREAYFPESGNVADVELVRGMKGKRVPMAGTIEVNVIDEDLTRLLLFEQGGLDFVQLRGEVATRLLAGDKRKPEYAARGITRHVVYEPFLFSVYFNTKDPTIGSMTNERVALRRAIAMAWDTDESIKVVLAGQAAPANQMISPGVTGHDPTLPVSRFTPRRRRTPCPVAVSTRSQSCELPATGLLGPFSCEPGRNRPLQRAAPRPLHRRPRDISPALARDECYLQARPARRIKTRTLGFN